MLKRFFKTLILLVCAGIPCNLLAKILTQEEAAKIATDFFSAGDVSRLGRPGALQLARTSKKSDGTPVYYVFNAKDGRGFIIISADDKAIPVIGYSYDSSFEADKVSDVTTTVIDNAARLVAVGSPGIRRIAGETESKKELNTSKWRQEAPFNAQIPNRRLVGCVGTAMAIVMKHHKHPAKGTGSLDGTSFATDYKWENMKEDDYRSGYTADQADAVATLMAHCAISIKTDFGQWGSSAYEVRVPAALINYFGYDPGVSYKKRSETDRKTWDDIIVKEIDANRPVIYSGQDVSSGHAFVCDGYEKKGGTPYFHINWGWGGMANAFYASDALTPTTHNYNDQTTIIYNIKPKAEGTPGECSPIHITSDEQQVGMTSDATDIEANNSFTVRAGALKNVSYDNFSGKIAPALFSSDGQRKALLTEGSNLTLSPLQVLSYTDFNNCTVPDGTSIADSDVVRLVTWVSSDTSKCLPVAGDLITINEVKAKNNTIPYFHVNIPSSVDGATITKDAEQVIKGRDYSFNVTASDDDKVVTVKANGFILTPQNESNYKITNVKTDQTISVTAQSSADVVSKRSLWVTAGNLANLIGESEAGTIKDLSLYGTIDARDFTFMRDRMRIETLDISNVTIAASGSEPANAIPTNAFQNYSSLKHIDLPKNLTTLKIACFNEAGLTSIEIPASVSNYEYNVFLNCSKLNEVIVRRTTPAWINWCVFTGTPLQKLVVPKGARNSYQNKDNWKKFKEITEQDATAPATYKVVIQDAEGVSITPETDSTEVKAGSRYVFTVDTDDSYGDARLEVHANATKLTADGEGRYTATINSNTLIHVNFVSPTPIVGESKWKLTGERGGIGIATDVINVIPGKPFSIRANALDIPQEFASMFYAAVLTGADNSIKEFISPVSNNPYNNYGKLPCTFNCMVKESAVREGNLIRIVTSYDMKDWYIVRGTDGTVKDSLKAVGNEVVYHKVTMPEVQGATIQGAVDKIAHGMDFSTKVIPVIATDLITVTVNGKREADRVSVANIKKESVKEDLDIAIQVVAANDSDYTTYNIYPGELDSLIKKDGFPSRLKLTGEMNAEDFKVLQDNAAKLEALDLTDVTIVPDKTLPSYAFAGMGGTSSALKTVRLPNNLERIEANAFYRCMGIKEITIPATVKYIGDKAFTYCTALEKITALSEVPAELGGNPFPANPANITLEVPEDAIPDYKAAEWWKDLDITRIIVYYHIQIDQERTFAYNGSVKLANIERPETGKTTTVQLCLPNFKPTKDKKNPVARPGEAFKLYDNGQDVTNMVKLDSSSKVDPGGDYLVTFDEKATDTTSLRFPQNHTIDVVFYHDIQFSGLSEKAEIALVDTDSVNVWDKVPMEKFVEGSTETPTLYKEGGNYRFSVKSKDADLIPVVRVFTNDSVAAPAPAALAADGEAGTDSTATARGELLSPDENGIYTISNLQSDVDVEITMGISVEEDETVKAENVPLIDDGEAALLTELNVKGEMKDSTYACLREKFKSLENLDLSEATNTDIADSAFAGMENLTSVTIPESVTSIGKGAFKGCTQLRSVFLNSVNAIGEGAFEGCSSLTSIMVCGDDSVQTILKRATKAAGITENSFAGINPNCIVYITKGLKEGIEAKKNVVLNGDSTFEALTDIVLTDTCTLSIPTGFSLAGKTISLSTGLEYPSEEYASKGWKGIVLPFAPTQIKDETDKEYVINPESQEGITVKSFDEEGTELTVQDSIKANKPYMIHLNTPTKEEVRLTFSATDTVPMTPEAASVAKAGKNYTLYGNYAPLEADTTLYVLDESGEKFVRVTPEDSLGTLAPVSVYAKATGTEANDWFEIGSVYIPTNVDSPYSGRHGLRIQKSGSGLVIQSDEERAIRIFTVSGVHVATVTLSKGVNTISLAPGIYVVDGVKVIL